MERNMDNGSSSLSERPHAEVPKSMLSHMIFGP